MSFCKGLLRVRDLVEMCYWEERLGGGGEEIPEALFAELAS